MTFGPRSIAACLTATLVALSACSRSRSVAEMAAVGAECTRCHGGTDNASGAPPKDLQGRTDTTLPSVGAHSTHIAAGVDCSACHVKPTSVGSPGHIDGAVTLTWGSIATANGKLSPTFVETTGVCSNVYCHGSFFGGNATNAPSWTHVGEGGAACGTCHTIPPPLSTGHPQRTDCGQCHGGYTATSVNAATHVNGHVDVLDLACTTCHGDPARTATTQNPLLAASPPVDTHGNTDASSPGVGAHQAHLTDGPLRVALACTECHQPPTSLDGHPNGTTVFTWGSLATTGGATPSYAGGACASTYCHGATLNAGGTNHTPQWTGGSAQVACGTCHGLPPPAPHPQNTSCEKCHQGYSISSVNPATHVNGQPDVVGLTCSSCHGDSTRAATTTNPQLPAAPPVDTHGNLDTTSPGVGAHQAHLNDGTMRVALPCTSCHAVPTSFTHATGTVTFSWSALATTGGATPSYAGGACTSTYCHGATLGAGGTNHAPAWIGGSAEAACGTCHSIPPPASANHVQNTNCGGCHPGYTASSVNPATHVNGSIDLSLSCTSCHGDSTRANTTLNPRLSAAPPVDTAGNTDPSFAGVGAHQAHLNDGTLRVALACTECHAVPASLTSHPTGTVTFSWGPLATTGGAAPSFSGATCSNTYCHGSTLNHGGTNHEPSWTGGSSQVACGTCHGAPPPSPHPQTTACGGCHGAGYSATTVNTATHVNGTLDILQLTCTSCHGDSTKQATPQSPLYAAPPVDTHGDTDTSFPGVGAHQAHLNDGTLRVALACTDCHAVPTSTSHSTGTVTFSWSALATANGTTSPTYAGGSCSNTYCHGSTLSAGGTSQAPQWTGGSAQAACGTCHSTPPPSPHPQNVSCGSCHGSAYSLTTVDKTLHINGTIDVGSMTCTSCHGDPTRAATALNPQLPAAPPVDTSGNTVSVRVGAHQTHLNGSALSAPLACTQCHTVPQSLTTHPTGTLDLTWGSLATGGGANTPTFEPITGTCSSVYCHGSYSGVFVYQQYDYSSGTTVPVYYPYSSVGGMPIWSGTSMTCTSCHDDPPRAGNTWHSGLHGYPNDYNECQLCHPDAYGENGLGVSITNPALHVNGVVDVNPQWNSNCLNCH